MSKGKIIGLSVLGIAGAFIALIIGSYISAYNGANIHEQGIKATYKNNENILATYGQKIEEAAQIPEMQRDDVAKVFRDAMNGRYGDQGSKAVVQFIREQNPTLDSSVYTKLQSMIEAGRNDFQRGQTMLIDRKRAYETEMGSFWRGFWIRTAGFPKIDLADFKIVSTDRASEAFRTGREQPLKLRQP